MSTYYHILGISSNASKEEVKTAYRKLSIKFHPDKNEGDAYFSKMFQQVNEAYRILFDDEERRKYDFQLGEQSKSQSQAERLKKLEEELAYKNQLLYDKDSKSKPSTVKSSSKSKKGFTIKIHHLKFFLWIVILGFIAAIAFKKSINNAQIPNTKEVTIKKSKKIREKRNNLIVQ